MDERLLRIIKQNYDKAVSAQEIGSAAEAASFMEVVQRLLNKHKLDMTEVEWRLEQKKDPVKMHKFVPEQYGLKRLNERVTWTEQLAHVIAEENNCTIIVLFDSNAFWLVGSRHNRMITEWLIAMMISTGERLCAQAKEDLADFGPMVLTGFDENFYYGFVTGIHERYQALKREQLDGVDRDKALIRLSQEKALVKQFIDDLQKSTPLMSDTTSKAVATYHNPLAQAIGQEAAHEVALKATVVKSGNPNVQHLPRGNPNG